MSDYSPHSRFRRRNCLYSFPERSGRVLLKDFFYFVNCCFRPFCLHFLPFHNMDGAEFFKMVANSCKQHMLVSYCRSSYDLEVRDEFLSNRCSWWRFCKFQNDPFLLILRKYISSLRFVSFFKKSKSYKQFNIIRFPFNISNFYDVWYHFLPSKTPKKRFIVYNWDGTLCTFDFASVFGRSSG